MGASDAAAARGATQQQQTKGASKIAQNILISGLGVSCGTTVTNPIDVIKTRLQLQPAAASGAGSNPGLVTTGLLIVRHEGLLRLWAGWRPAVARAMCYGGLRLGLYTPIKNVISSMQQQQVSSQHSRIIPGSSQPNSSSGQAGVSAKVLAGTASGALAAALLSPTELVKVRLQQPGSPYHSSSQVVAAVVKADGVKGLWKGATPGVVRAAALTVSQCATYDEVKARVMAATSWPDSAATHLATAMITGVVSTTATNPVDVIKTFMFVGGSAHRNPLACAVAIYESYGLGGFWRGWLANYARLGPQTVMTFLVVEQLRHMAGMEPL